MHMYWLVDRTDGRTVERTVSDVTAEPVKFRTYEPKNVGRFKLFPFIVVPIFVFGFVGSLAILFVFRGMLKSANRIESH